MMRSLFDEVAEAVQGFRDGKPLIEPSCELADNESVLGEVPEELRPFFSALIADNRKLAMVRHNCLMGGLGAMSNTISDALSRFQSGSGDFSPDDLKAKLAKESEGVHQECVWADQRHQIFHSCFWQPMHYIFPTPPNTALGVRKGWKVVAEPNPEPKFTVHGLDELPEELKRAIAAGLGLEAKQG